jgi:Fe-S-cluster containining protein
MSAPGFKEKFYDITALVQTEFDRNLELYGDKIQCRKGCSKCCSQIFRITAIDAWIIGEHIKSLHVNRQEELKQKAAAYRQGEPCPALGSEGECTIYEARPVICRRFGMPIYDYKNPQNVHACELNFSQGEEISDELLVPNQTEIGKKWDKLKEEFGEGSTTIAEAILNS